MKYHHIAIEREYGSGGTLIARGLAESLGVPCYGREILARVSQQRHVPVEQLERYEERATGSFLYSLYAMAQAGSADKLSPEGYVYIAEQAAIRELAGYGPCVFIGHCAMEALKERERVLRVFVRADKDSRARRARSDYGIAEQDVDATLRRFDKKRAGYYYANTAQKWDDMRNYDITLDSGALGVEGCVAALRALCDR